MENNLTSSYLTSSGKNLYTAGKVEKEMLKRINNKKNYKSVVENKKAKQIKNARAPKISRLYTRI